MEKEKTIKLARELGVKELLNEIYRKMIDKKTTSLSFKEIEKVSNDVIKEIKNAESSENN